MLNIEIGAEKIVDFFGFPINNGLILSWIVMAVLLLLAFLVYKNVKAVPGLLQNIFEIVVDGLLNAISGMFENRKQAEKYFPVIATIFILVLVSNWMGILPGVGSIGFYEVHDGHEVLVPLLRSPGSDLNFTLALAIVTVLTINILGVAAIGFFKHFGKFISFKNPIDFFVGILELISEVVKMVSFSFRLFGNVFAGEVMLIIAAFFMPYLLPVPILMLEIFVGFIQALVFGMLAAVFISLSVNHGYGEH